MPCVSGIKWLYTFKVTVESICPISEQNSRHLVRMFRSFLEGFCLLVNKKSFGNPLPVSDTFALSVDTLIAVMKSLENK